MQAIEAVRHFFTDPTIKSDVWLNQLNAYVSAPHKVKDSQKFTILDHWYHGLDVSTGYITKVELVEIMKWKLTRGKMRPLLAKIEALDEAVVQQATLNAINYLRGGYDEDQLRRAFDALTKPLKGVGPATASAVLAKWNTAIPFMSDAGLIAVNGNTNYTMNDYLKYYQGIQAKVAQLNQDGMTKRQWTAKEVEAVLHLVYSRYDLKVVA
jgi:hypothetical protein